MDKQKAERLDAILKALSMKTFLSKTDIQNKIGIDIEYSDLHTINSQKYNENGVVVTAIQNRRKVYKLTPDGSAFRTDVGFVNLQKTESRSRRTGTINLLIALGSVLIAAASFVFSVIQTNAQSSQYEKLENRIDGIEIILNK